MSNLTNNTAELRGILAAVNALPEAGGGGINPTGEIEITENGTYDVTNYASAEVSVPSKEPILQEGNATPTKSQQTINPPSGADGFSNFVVGPIPDQYIIPEGTAEITKNGEHDVTGYAKVDVNVPDIPAVTEELSVTENGTWEPGTGVDGFSKVVVNVPDIPAVVQPLEVTENGTYTAPAGVDGYSPVTVNVPSENLDAEISAQAAKIDQLLTILDGKAAGGGGGTDTRFVDLVTDTLTEVNDASITEVRANAFYGASSVKTVTLPNVTTIGTNAFRDMDSLETVDLPKLTPDLPTYAFQDDIALKNVNVPSATRVQNRAFSGCSALEKLELGEVTSIGNYVFTDCSSLTALIIRATSKFPTLSNVSTFTNTPIANGTGYIYVYRSQVDTGKSASIWSNFAAQFRAIEDYPEITGG